MTHRAFHYKMPESAVGEPKTIVDIAPTEVVSVSVQVVNNGGETVLHSHNGEDVVWLVLGGQVAFYDDEGKKILLGKHDFIVVPSGTQNWFESVGDEPLEIARVAARDLRVPSTRTYAIPTERNSEPGKTPHVQARELSAI